MLKYSKDFLRQRIQVTVVVAIKDLRRLLEFLAFVIAPSVAVLPP